MTAGASPRFALRSIQTLADLQELPLYLDTRGIFSEEIEVRCGIEKSRITGALVLGELGNVIQAWVTASPNPSLMTARFKRVL